MLSISGKEWVPVFLFFVLGCFFLQKALRPRAKQSWAWGRSGGIVPLSRRSCFFIAATFFSIIFIIGYGPETPLISAALFLVCFLLCLVSGCVDTWRYRKERILSNASNEISEDG